MKAPPNPKPFLNYALRPDAVMRMRSTIWGLSISTVKASHGITRNPLIGMQKPRRRANHVPNTISGLLYLQGQGVPKNPQKAVNLFTKAAEQGETHAQTVLGASYFNGQGVAKDYTKAAHWFGKAADGGDPQAQLVLSVMYLKPLGVKRDFVTAAKWLMIAKSSSSKKYATSAHKALAKLEQAMDRQQIAKSKQLAAAWKSGHHEE